MLQTQSWPKPSVSQHTKTVLHTDMILRFKRDFNRHKKFEGETMSLLSSPQLNNF